MTASAAVPQQAPDLSIPRYFKKLKDPRRRHRRLHHLQDILVIALCAVIAGAQDWQQVATFGRKRRAWLQRFLELPNGIPSHDTFNRVFAALDPKRFLECFLRWTQSLRTAVSGEIVALDGKALRRALNQGQALPYVVSAWAVSNGLVLVQLKVADKSNEITAVPELLRALELKGCIVTLDAMGCQKKIAKQIIDSHADYVLALKGNHETYVARVLSDPSKLADWKQVGGLYTLLSYGVTLSVTEDPRAQQDVAEAFNQALPDSHRRFFQGLALSFTCGDFSFAHAGARPGIPLWQQRQQDLLWIREDFLLHEKDFGKVVI